MNYADRVKDTSASVGTGPITLFGAPITGFRSFLSAFQSGAVDVPYAIDDGAGNWEIGIGSFADSVLTRTQVLSSSSNGGLVDFVAGKKSVICTLPADLVESATNRSIAAASESAGHAVQTAQDRAQTAIDKAATAEDRIATAADREQTGMDAAAASSAKTAAELAASSAAESASSAADASRLTVGTVTTVPAGSSATATITGQPGAQVLDLTLPAGADGAPGPQGPQGDVGDVNPQMPLILAAAEQAAADAAGHATNAAQSAALLGSAAMVTATGTVALADASAVYQLIDPNGANRDVTLPALDSNHAGRSFVVKNAGSGAYSLAVKYGATQIGPSLMPGYSLSVLWTGSEWVAL